MTTPQPRFTAAEAAALGWSDTAAAELEAIERDLQRREAIRDDEHADYLADLAAYRRGELDTPPY